jgi:TPR repeat protein
MYFDIAANPPPGHPLAVDYAESLKNEMSQFEDITSIAADAYSRALTWATPFEYYPGATPGGVLYSDESLPGLAQRMALEHIREIPPWVVEHALEFRGYLRRPRGIWHASPADMGQAVWKFQDAMKFETTGFLSPPEEVRLIQMSALDGDAEMQNRLGIMYAKGIGVPRNFPRAEKWFSKAADQNHGEALFNLGVLYKAGPLGVAPNMYKAISMDLQSAAAGYNPARCELLDLLAKAGIGCHHWARR